MAEDNSIQLPKIEMFNVANIVEDDTNPNSMTSSSFEALKDNIRRYGFIVPVITNKNGVIADGYHRYKAAIDLGMEKIPIIKLDMDEVSRRTLRQVMNKLRGTHDFEKDVDEFKWLQENDEDFNIASLLPDHDFDFLYTMDEADAIQGDDMDQERRGTLTKAEADSLETLDGFAQGEIRHITLYYNNQQYIKAIAQISRLLGQLKIDTPTQLMQYLMDYYEENNC